MVGADMLGNATGFTGRHLGTADVIQQRGFAMVNVAHDGHHRRTRQGFGVLLRDFIIRERFRIVERSHHGFVAHFFHHDHRGVLV